MATSKHTKPASTTDRTPIEISCDAPAAKEVFVAGTFNDWKPETARRSSDGNGRWIVMLPLPTGRYEYKFVVDGRWCCEPDCEDDAQAGPDRIPNAFGTMNRVLDVA